MNSQNPSDSTAFSTLPLLQKKMEDTALSLENVELELWRLLRSLTYLSPADEKRFFLAISQSLFSLSWTSLLLKKLSLKKTQSDPTSPGKSSQGPGQPSTSFDENKIRHIHTLIQQEKFSEAAAALALWLSEKP